MNWSEYGKWRHPNEWWGIKLIEWIKIKYPDKLKNNPKIIDVTETEIVFGMKHHYGHLHLSKETILKDLENE